MGGGGGPVKSEAVPWAPQGEQLRQFYKGAQSAYGDPKEFFSGSTVAGRSGTTLQAHSMAKDLLSGNRPADAANDFLGGVLGGDYMGANPELDSMFANLSNKVTEQYNRTVLPGVNSRFASAGQTRSTGYDAALSRSQQDLASSLGDVGTEIYYGDYERRMGDRFKAIDSLGQVQGAQFGDINLASNVGREEESYEQSLINEAIQRHQFSQNEFDMRLDQYGGRVGQNTGFGTTTQSGGQQGGNAGLSAGLGVLSLLASVVGSPALGAVVGGVGTAATGGG